MYKRQVMNLTAITEECEVVTKHFSDSLSLFGLLREMQAGGDAWYKTCNAVSYTHLSNESGQCRPDA